MLNFSSLDILFLVSLSTLFVQFMFSERPKSGVYGIESHFKQFHDYGFGNNRYDFL